MMNQIPDEVLFVVEFMMLNIPTGMKMINHIDNIVLKYPQYFKRNKENKIIILQYQNIYNKITHNLSSPKT